MTPCPRCAELFAALKIMEIDYDRLWKRDLAKEAWMNAQVAVGLDQEAEIRNLREEVASLKEGRALR